MEPIHGRKGKAVKGATFRAGDSCPCCGGQGERPGMDEEGFDAGMIRCCYCAGTGRVLLILGPDEMVMTQETERAIRDTPFTDETYQIQ